jgi:hypothetical protein
LLNKQTKKTLLQNETKKELSSLTPPPPPILHRGRVSIAVGAAAESAACGESLSRSAKEEGDGEETPPCQPSSKKKEYLGSAGSFSVALPAAAAAARMLAQIQKEKKLKGRIASIIGSLRLASNPHPPRGYICDAPHGSRALAESISRSRGPGRGVFN